MQIINVTNNLWKLDPRTSDGSPRHMQRASFQDTSAEEKSYGPAPAEQLLGVNSGLHGCLGNVRRPSHH